jgi:membrane protease YdiL (CAAX protease family)
MYWRTNSIVPGIVLHWINNTVAFVLYNLIPGAEDARLVDIFGGDQRSVYLALAFSLCIFLPSLYQLTIRLKKEES